MSRPTGTHSGIFRMWPLNTEAATLRHARCSAWPCVHTCKQRGRHQYEYFNLVKVRPCSFVDLQRSSIVRDTATLLLYEYVKTQWFQSLIPV
jgi:hypothetical protein